ncbi:MAG: hypothetical protein HUK24_02490, partial [Sphaerochaetaceae bacterium]|nr:hypothetical protein [Sphaerochaetaceae bacterium]
MSYTAGTKVFWKSCNRNGQTTGKENNISGMNFIEVKFDNGQIKYISEKQLEIIGNETLDFNSLFRLRNFSPFQNFRQYLT